MGDNFSVPLRQRETTPAWGSAGFVGAIVLVLTAALQLVGSITDAVSAGQPWHAGITEGGIAALVEAGVGLAILIWRLVKRNSPRITMGKGNGPSKAVVAMLALAMAGQVSCSALSPETAGKILRTVSAVGSIIDDWCDPDAYEMDSQLCDTIMTYYEVGEAGAGIILPYYTEPERGEAAGMSRAASARVGVTSCMRVLATCQRVEEQPGLARRAPVSEHLRVCEEIAAGCAADGAEVIFAAH